MSKETIGPMHNAMKLGLSPNLNSYEQHKRITERLREDIELRIQELNNKHDGELGYGFFDEEKDMSVKLGFGE